MCNPRFAVHQIKALRAVGRQIREIFDTLDLSNVLDRFEQEDITLGLNNYWISLVRPKLCKVFGAKMQGSGL